jgi:cell wall-associated NlpC family hydrolase
MSEGLLLLACTAAVTTWALLAPAPAAAVPDPVPTPTAQRKTAATLLTEFQQLYHKAEQATETYNAATEKLTLRQADVARLDGQLTRTRLDLQSSRVQAGRLARQQYQNSTSLSPYVRLLFARDPQHALDEGHLIGQLTRERASTVQHLSSAEKQADTLARAARRALDDQQKLADRQKKAHDDVERHLKDIEKLLASLSTQQLAAVAASEHAAATAAQRRFLASGALGPERTPTADGGKALVYAVEQIGKPYVWGAAGPTAYDCSGLTSRAWEHAGRTIPRTSQEQWAKLPHISLRDLRPGDLVLYFPEATHVALYLGEGRVIEAPRPGANVRVSPIATYPVLGAVRPR